MQQRSRTYGKSPVAAIILAAGRSRRMGRNKLLLLLRDKAILTHVVERVRSIESIEQVIVVTGHAADATAQVVAGLGATLVHNPRYADGEMLSSVQAGIAAVSSGPRQCAAFFLVLGDQPGVRAETFEQLIGAWRQSSDAQDARRARVISPTFRGKRGHPILLASEGINEILHLAADATLKTYVERHAAESIEVEVDDPAVCADVDTPEQYRQLTAAAAAAGSLTCPTEETLAKQVG